MLYDIRFSNFIQHQAFYRAVENIIIILIQPRNFTWIDQGLSFCPEELWSYLWIRTQILNQVSWDKTRFQPDSTHSSIYLHDDWEHRSQKQSIWDLTHNTTYILPIIVRFRAPSSLSAKQPQTMNCKSLVLEREWVSLCSYLCLPLTVYWISNNTFTFCRISGHIDNSNHLLSDTA